MYNMFEIFVLIRSDYTLSSLANRIKELRNLHHLNQEQLGKIIGVAKSTISSYENGNSAPADEIKAAMCQYFNVSMDYLMGISKDVLIGSELKAMIQQVSLELDEPYDKLVDIFLNKRIPNDLTKESLTYFFCILLGKKTKTAQNEQPLSPELEALFASSAELSSEDIKKVIEYADLLRLKQKP